MTDLRSILLQLSRREDLTRDQMEGAFELLMSGQAADAQIGGLLIGLASKGTTVDELVGAATVMRRHVVPIVDPTYAGPLLDTCGTGGTGRKIFNVSTAAAIIIASCGVRVIKHGNRAATSVSGSADVLEALGVKIELTPEAKLRCLREANICFAFARNHHPSMKHVAAARTALGVPTIFNMLGPLTNPGGAKFQLMGVFAPELTERLAGVLRDLGSTRAWVVHADDGLDELSTLGKTRISELRDGHITTSRLDPTSLGLAYAKLSDLQTNSAKDSAAVLHDIFSGAPGPQRDIVALNAAAGLVISGGAADLPSGLARVSAALDDGSAAKTLRRLIDASNAE